LGTAQQNLQQLEKILPMGANIAFKKVRSISNALSDNEEHEDQRHRNISSQRRRCLKLPLTLEVLLTSTEGN